MTTPPPSRTVEWTWALVVFVLLSGLYASQQPVDPREGQGGGGQIYHAMAKAFPREVPPKGPAPFVYRVGTPLAAATVAKSLDWVIAAGFDRLNILLNAVSVALLLVLLQRHVPSALARVLLICAFMIEPHSPMRLSYFHPVSPDSAAMTGLLAGLVGVEWFWSRPGPVRACWLAILVSAGTVFHESTLVVGVSALFAPAASSTAASGPLPSRLRARLTALDLTGAWLPLISGLVTLAALHAWVVPTPSAYSASGEMLRWLAEKSVFRFGLAWLLVFGPLLVLPFYFWRTTVGFLREHPALTAYLVIWAVLAWVGDGETERLVAWASPVVYVLIGRAFRQANFSSLGLAVVVLAQGLSSRVFSPIGGPLAPPTVGTEVWERLGWANTSWALSYQNMWSQFCAPSMVGVYVLWYGVTAACVVALLFQRAGPAEAERSNLPRWRLASWRPSDRLIAISGAVVAVSPIMWLASSGFYARHFDQPGFAYLPYNLARIWSLPIMIAAFWSTGTRVIQACSTVDAASARRSDRFLESTFCGAAVWSVAMVLLAMIHLYYLWLVLPALFVAVVLAIHDLLARRAERSRPGDGLDARRWGFVGLLLRFAVALHAAAILLTIVLWGHFGGDNDVPGNYLPYYAAVLRDHSNAPNEYWVHFFASKGNGLAFLWNVLSDAQGATLATYALVLLGAGLMWRFAAQSVASAGSAIGLVAASLYLQYYASQGAYAKPHIIRNTFILFIVLEGIRAWRVREPEATASLVARIAAATAVVVLSPLAIVLLLPIFFMQAALGWGRRGESARKSLVAPVWAFGVAVLVCAYNFIEVGLPELHAMPSFVGRIVDIDRLGRWMDPGLAYIDYRLAFVQTALPNTAANDSVAVLAPTYALGQVVVHLLSPATLTVIGGAIVVLAIGVGLSSALGRPPSSEMAAPAGSEALLSSLYLLAVLAMLATLQMFGGGPGSSMGRFTDFANPLGLALGATLLTAAWSMAGSTLPRMGMGGVMAVMAVAALYLGAPPVLALSWHESAGFLLGRNSYASMNEVFWDTKTAESIARLVPEGTRVELLNFLPGFTAVPTPPFQRPDGCVYLRDYTKVLYGPSEEAAAIYASSNIEYFLFDVAPESPVMWSGFAPIFTPASIKSRMRLVTHVTTSTRDLYLLTWRQATEPSEDDALEAFLSKWAAKVAAERKSGSFAASYDNGALYKVSR